LIIGEDSYKLGENHLQREQPIDACTTVHQLPELTLLALNPGETGNDYWTSGQQSPGQAYQYLQNYAAYETAELTVIYPQIQIAYAKAFNLWQLYSFSNPTGSRPPGITCNGSNGRHR
jgi:hypothetical protein